jgi:hypothetical protein
MAGCGDNAERPLADGYTLQGVVFRSQTVEPLSDVNVVVGWETSREFHRFATTDAAGRFTFQPSPATAPNGELFRFEKAGYVALEVLARSATRLEEYRYRLEVHLDSVPAP